MDKAKIGALGESLAKRIYTRRGFKIISENFFNRFGKRLGELDFVAIKNKQIHFVEVKTRSSTRFGLPEESITAQKQLRLRKAVALFLNLHQQYAQFKPHIDVLIVELSPFDKKPRKIKIYSDAIGDSDY